MSTHLIDKERAFVDGLEAETGVSLAGWMALIDESGLKGRNEIIDWLRQRGFPFAKASWLERIHHNGGELIYAGAPQRRPVPRPETRPPSPSPSPPKQAAASAATLPAPRPPPAPRLVPSKSETDLDALLQSAKAYRPLAQALLRAILAAVPGADTRLAGATIAFELGPVFAAMSPGPKGVRLHLPDAGMLPQGWQRARAGPAPELEALTVSLVLTDAREINPALMQLVTAATRGGPP